MSDTENTAVSDVAEDVDETALPGRLNLKVELEDVGPCRKRIQVVVPESDLNGIRSSTLDEFVSKANVPGFRVGRVPRALVEAKFRRELTDELKQRVLVQSLEQLTEENNLDPINEPDMDVESIDIPDAGDFEYSFEVEVRPDVDLPDFAEITIDRPTREITDEDIQKYIDQMLIEYGERVPHDGAASAGDFVTLAATFNYKDEAAREIPSLSVRVLPTLRFKDCEVTGFGELMSGASVGDKRESEVTISTQAEHIPMRGESLAATFEVTAIQKFQPATVDKELLERIGVESEEALQERTRQILEYQSDYRQRQSAREQLLEKITASGDWALPEELVLKQVENALHREVLEMQQAGYTPSEIQARENELRQKSVSVTEQAMKEHFVLDQIATSEGIEVDSQDLEMEIMKMSFQSGETPRRLRARLVKTGVIENLEAQIRERKAVDIALERAQYNEVPFEDELVGDLDVEAVDDAICNVMFARSTKAAAE